MRTKNDEIRIVEWTETVCYEYGRPGARTGSVVVGRRLEWGDGSWIGYRYDNPISLVGNLNRVVSDSIQAEVEAYTHGAYKRPMNDETLLTIAHVVDCNHLRLRQEGLIP